MPTSAIISAALIFLTSRGCFMFALREKISAARPKLDPQAFQFFRQSERKIAGHAHAADFLFAQEFAAMTWAWPGDFTPACAELFLVFAQATRARQCGAAWRARSISRSLITM